jgi:hypothetical protein
MAQPGGPNTLFPLNLFSNGLSGAGNNGNVGVPIPFPPRLTDGPRRESKYETLRRLSQEQDESFADHWDTCASYLATLQADLSKYLETPTDTILFNDKFEGRISVRAVTLDEETGRYVLSEDRQRDYKPNLDDDRYWVFAIEIILQTHLPAHWIRCRFRIMDRSAELEFCTSPPHTFVMKIDSENEYTAAFDYFYSHLRDFLSMKPEDYINRRMDRNYMGFNLVKQ